MTAGMNAQQIVRELRLANDYPYDVSIFNRAANLIESLVQEPGKECQCTKDTAIADELAELRDEIERLKKEVAAVRAFSYRHRHSEWGIAD